jgi:hypothetical protein
MYIGNNEVYAYDIGKGAKLKATVSTTASTVRILIRKDATVSNLTFYPMIRYEDVADATYEQSNTQTLTALTPNGLPGIPVSTGGNYTDEDGQQWICDEVDYGKGVYIQRVKRVVLDGTNMKVAKASATQNDNNYIYYPSIASNINYNCAPMCSHFKGRIAAIVNDSVGYLTG